MKPSYYNNYIPVGEGTEILYNTLSGAILVVDEETKKTIENIQKAEIPEAILSNFKQYGVIVEDDEDELLKFREIYNAVRYDPQEVTFVLAPTATCNLACDYCIQRVDESLVGKTHQTVTMSDTVLRNTLLFVKHTTEHCSPKKLPLDFYGGEPLMEKKLLFYILDDLQQWSEERSLRFTPNLATNSTLVTSAFVDELSQYTIGFIRTTLDGPEEVNNQYRHYKNGKGTYEEIVTAIGLLLDTGYDVRVQINLNRQYKRLPELFDDLTERGLNKIKIRFYPIIDSFITIPEAQKHYGILDESFSLPESKIAIPYEEISRARDYAYWAAFNGGFKLPPPPLGIKSGLCRGAYCHSYLVDPSGDVYKCVGSMLIQSLRIGCIHEDGQLERYPFFYKWMDTDPTYIEKCSSCTLLPSCGGGCVVGRQVGKIPHFCEVSFFPGEEYIKLYIEQEHPEELGSG